MVKRQKEKQYLSAREQRDYQAIRSGASNATSLGSSHLPFSHCALTLRPFQTPVCNEQGILFEKDALTGFLFKYKKDPVTGSPMSTREMITLNMTRDEETGDWQCPVLQKNLGDHIKVVAIRQRDAENTANVYSFEAFQELNVKAKNYSDLISGRPFDKKRDVLILNDPHDKEFNQLRDMTKFYHIQYERELQAKDEASNNKEGDIRYSKTASRVLDKLRKKRSNQNETESSEINAKESSNKRSKLEIGSGYLDGVILAEDVTGVKYNTEQGASSFTSTGVTLAQDAKARPATDEEIRQAEFRVMKTTLKGRKGYVRINLDIGGGQTSMALILELHCDIVPRTCANFLGLSAEGEYDGCVFHRLIPKFMLQGGSAKDGEKDESIWGGSFADEFDDRLTHSGPGIVSMANSGSGTNMRQFFITFASCQHLDRKHSVFAKVIRGMEHLTALEAIPTDKKNNPTETILIESIDVLENPAQIAHDMEQKRLREILESRRQEVAARTKQAAAKSEPSQPTASKQPAQEGGDPVVGHYLSDKLKKKGDLKKAKTIFDGGDSEGTVVHRLSLPPKKTAFKDFSGW